MCVSRRGRARDGGAGGTQRTGVFVVRGGVARAASLNVRPNVRDRVFGPCRHQHRALHHEQQQREGAAMPAEVVGEGSADTEHIGVYPAAGRNARLGVLSAPSCSCRLLLVAGMHYYVRPPPVRRRRLTGRQNRRPTRCSWSVYCSRVA
jgi:hypothetical protein